MKCIPSTIDASKGKVISASMMKTLGPTKKLKVSSIHKQISYLL